MGPQLRLFCHISISKVKNKLNQLISDKLITISLAKTDKDIDSYSTVCVFPDLLI